MTSGKAAFSGHEVTERCLWCGHVYEFGGRCSRQHFCKAAHGRAYDQAARDWVRRAIADGLLTVADLQKTSRKTRAFVGAPSRLRDGRSAPTPAAAPEGPDGEDRFV